MSEQVQKPAERRRDEKPARPAGGIRDTGEKIKDAADTLAREIDALLEENELALAAHDLFAALGETRCRCGRPFDQCQQMLGWVVSSVVQVGAERRAAGEWAP